MQKNNEFGGFLLWNMADFYYGVWRIFTIEYDEILQKVRLKSVIFYKNSA